MPTHQLQVAEGGGYEDLSLATARDEITRDLLAVSRVMPSLNDAHHVLRGGGFMLDVARINVCAVVEQVLRDLYGRGDMQRSLTVVPPASPHPRILLPPPLCH